MPVCLDICLMSERYEAGDGEDPRAPEWPPHPARVFSVRWQKAMKLLRCTNSNSYLRL